MKQEFAPFLPRVLPGIFNMATLNPEMGISGAVDLAELTDVLKEVTPSTGATEEKKIQVVTD